MKSIFSNPYIKGTLLILAGLFLGWLLFHKTHSEPSKSVTETHEKHTVWTCSMHPQIRRDAPGKCPICAMDLIPLDQQVSKANPDAIQMDEAAVKIANIQTTVVSRQKTAKEIRLYGKVQSDERLIQTLPAHIPGRIERLLVNFTGETVAKGQVIAQVYSPELLTAQQELIESLKFKDSNPAIVEAARGKLRLWKLSDSQIVSIEKGGKVNGEFEVRAVAGGTVLNRKVNVGDYVGLGQPLYEIVDLSRVWVMFDAYESDLAWIHKGAQVTFNVQSLPGKQFSGTISFVDPAINAQTRTARVRLDVPNSAGHLKPEMFATGTIRSVLDTKNELAVPKSAVLWTGKRSVVYVKDQAATTPAFVRREVTLGSESGDWYVVKQGLSEGDEVVTNGTFAVDAAAQLAGKPSMMEPK
ncbi:MAG: efflux RND transporter periplasmic adaptor subunit [Bacteroidota bacterium]|nr:efflux RND transporter periplasmic adaptor subunit [Bacteroidota bacterium]